MSKRLHDTEIWKKPWFNDLEDRMKLFWFYILSDCDAAGIWTANWKIAEAYLGKLPPPPRLVEIFKNQILVLNGGTYWFIRDFIRFQYGFPVSPKHTMFKTLKNLLLNRGLDIDTVCDTVYDTVLYTDKEKVKEKEKEIRGVWGKKNTIEQRELKFIEQVKSHSEYPIEMLEKFINHFTEKNKPQTKMKFEMEKTWELKKRLVRWANNEKVFQKPQPAAAEKVFKGENITLQRLNNA